MVEAAKRFYTPEEYLALEEKSDHKHEYYNGHIYLIAGAQPPHNRITQNLQGLLYVALRGQSCEGFGSDQRVYIAAHSFFTYPDLSIACNPQYLTINGLGSLTNPVVVIEVLSESTRNYGRPRKFQMYKGLPSLQHYIVIEQDFAWVDSYTRHDPFWYIDTFDALDQNLHITALDISLALADIYERVELAMPPSPTFDDPQRF